MLMFDAPTAYATIRRAAWALGPAAIPLGDLALQYACAFAEASAQLAAAENTLRIRRELDAEQALLSAVAEQAAPPLTGREAYLSDTANHLADQVDDLTDDVGVLCAALAAIAQAVAPHHTAAAAADGAHRDCVACAVAIHIPVRILAEAGRTEGAQA